MENFYLFIAITLIIIILVPFYRVLVGPTIFDRLLSVGAIGTKTIVLICVVGIIFRRIELCVDIILTYAVLNFIALVVIARYFQNRESMNE